MKKPGFLLEVELASWKLAATVLELRNSLSTVASGQHLQNFEVDVLGNGPSPAVTQCEITNICVPTAEAEVMDQKTAR